MKLRGFNNSDLFRELVTLVQVEDETVIFQEVFPQVLLHVLLLLQVQLVYHRLQFAHWWKHQPPSELLPFLLIDYIVLVTRHTLWPLALPVPSLEPARIPLLLLFLRLQHKLVKMVIRLLELA